MRRRAQKLGEPRRTVAEAQWQYREARRRQAAALARLEPGEARPAALTDLRWLIQEYGVQLFAQELRTQLPVSAKRIEQAFAAAETALARR
jgi:ATP-dependent helicase HrpA